jgi:hypothetical protein
MSYSPILLHIGRLCIKKVYPLVNWHGRNNIRHFKLIFVIIYSTLLTSAFASRLQRLSQLACESNKLLRAYFLLVIFIEDMTHARDIGFLYSLDAVDGREVVRSVMFYMVRIQWIMTDSFSVWQSGSPHAWCAKNMALIETSIISSTITLVAIQSTRRTKKCGMMVLWPILPYVPGLKLWTLIAMCTTIPALHNLYTAKSSDGCLCIEFDLKNINKCRVIFGSVH